MPRRGGRVGVETADRRITDRHIRSRDGRIEGDAENRAVWQNEVCAGHIYPVCLGRDPGSEIESNLDVAVIGPDNRDALILRRILHLIDEGTISKCTLAKVRT